MVKLPLYSNVYLIVCKVITTSIVLFETLVLLSLQWTLLSDNAESWV